MAEVAIVGVGMTRFGNREEDLMELLVEASWAALEDARATDVECGGVFVGNMASGLLNRQTAVASALVDRLGLVPAPADRVENGPASGGSALAAGYRAVKSGLSDMVLVAGGEKMSDAPGPVVTETVATLTHPRAERNVGITLPALAALVTRLHAQRHGLSDRQRLQIAVKNHSNGAKNPRAHFQREITIEKAISSPVVSDPLRLYDCCPRSDGAAAILLANAEQAESFTDDPVFVRGSGQASDLQVLHEREDPLGLPAVRGAAARAFRQARLEPSAVDVVELHDAFTILELLEAENCGFFPTGGYARALEGGRLDIDGDLPVNPSGGLKARGHPWGATGVAQVCELVWQLRGAAGERQVEDPRVGFACNFGGFGNNVVCHVLSTEMGRDRREG
ncbi:MAG: thiolase domain-containing protein [Promethearchaeota archaeon]